jgi:uncharacterized protein
VRPVNRSIASALEQTVPNAGRARSYRLAAASFDTSLAPEPNRESFKMPGYFDLHVTPAGHFMFNLKAGNHEVILTSQVYKSKQAALDGIESVRNNSQIESRFERKSAKDNSPYFVLNASNGQVVGKSEMYSGAAAMENGIKSVIANGASKTIKGID